jgi:enoyl-CoA hydratase/carnithine racemase
VAVLIGSGDKAFCAGGDLKEMSAGSLRVPPPDFMPHLNRNIEIDKPVIAAVNGVALGGGFLLAQMCDLVVSAEHASFGITEARWGRGSPWANPLPWLVPPKVALEMMLTASPITAQRAYEVGLVNRVVPREELEEAATVLAASIAANAPLTVRAAKQMVYGAAEGLFGDTFDRAEELFRPAYESADAQEGPQSFKERRAPRWTGS